MALYLFRYVGSGVKPARDIERARALRGVTVVNENLQLGVVLEIENDLAVHQLKKMQGWTLYPSQQVEMLRDPVFDLPAYKGRSHLRLVPPTSEE